MNNEQKAAYIQAQAACAIIEGMSLLMDNLYAIKEGRPPDPHEAFEAIINKYGLHHNTVIEYLNDY